MPDETPRSMTPDEVAEVRERMRIRDEVFKSVGGFPDNTIARLIATMESLWERERVLLERLRLLDRIIVDHHSASVLRDEHDVCPVCDAEGGVAFFAATGRLLRGRGGVSDA